MEETKWKFERKYLYLALVIVLILMVLISLRLVIAQDEEIVSAAQFFEEKQDIPFIELTMFAPNGEAFTDNDLTSFPDGSMGVQLDVPADSGGNILLIIRSFDRDQLIQYLNDAEAYFAIVTLEAGQTNAPAPDILFGNILLDSLRTSLENNGQLETDDVRSVFADLYASGEGEARSLREIINQISEEDYSGEVLENALSTARTAIDAAVADDTLTSEEGDELYQTVSDAYSEVVEVDAAALFDAPAPASEEDALDGVTIDMELSGEAAEQCSSQTCIIYYAFRFDASIYRCCPHNYRARVLQRAEAQVEASLGSVSLRLWRVINGLSLWTFDAAGGTASNWVKLSACTPTRCESHTYDVRVTTTQDGSDYKIYGGWERG
jgi:hypothetical protein